VYMLFDFLKDGAANTFGYIFLSISTMASNIHLGKTIHVRHARTSGDANEQYAQPDEADRRVVHPSELESTNVTYVSLKKGRKPTRTRSGDNTGLPFGFVLRTRPSQSQPRYIYPSS
jgi:hypothetical protein